MAQGKDDGQRLWSYRFSSRLSLRLVCAADKLFNACTSVMEKKKEIGEYGIFFSIKGKCRKDKHTGWITNHSYYCDERYRWTQRYVGHDWKHRLSVRENFSSSSTKVIISACRNLPTDSCFLKDHTPEHKANATTQRCWQFEYQGKVRQLVHINIQNMHVKKKTSREDWGVTEQAKPKAVDRWTFSRQPA